MTQIGFVGVGLMGLPLAARLASRGHAVKAFDVLRERMDAARGSGAGAAASPADAARGAEVVLLCLPTIDAVEQAAFGAHGVASAVKPPQLVVDLSTVSVAKGKEFAARLKRETGCGWIDAPMSGGPPAAAAGTLTVMAGGEDADVARIKPLMAELAARFTHMGPPGSGLVAKMINQLIVGCNFAVTAEALVMAEAAGIDAARLPECLAGGYADSKLFQAFYPRMQKRDYAPQGYVRQMLKDLEMVDGFAGALHAPAPMMAQALSLYRMLFHLGHGELDTAAIFKLYER